MRTNYTKDNGGLGDSRGSIDSEPYDCDLVEELMNERESDYIFSDEVEGVDDVPEDFFNINREVELALIQNSYENITGLRDMPLKADISQYKEDEESQDNEDYEEDRGSEEDISHNKKKFKRLIIFGILGLAIIIISLIVGLRFLRGSSESMTVDDIKSQIRELYVSDAKDELQEEVGKSSIREIQGNLNNIKDISENDKNDLTRELNTISKYLDDSMTLDVLQSKDYDLNTKGTVMDMGEVEESLDTYSVSGLALNISDRLNKLSSEYNLYVQLMDELSSVTDYINFNENEYTDKIDTITHEANKKELSNLLQNLVIAKTNAKELEDLKQKEDEASREAAEKLKKNMEEQISSLEKEISRLNEDRETQKQFVIQTPTPVKETETKISESKKAPETGVEESTMESSEESIKSE